MADIGDPGLGVLRLIVRKAGEVAAIAAEFLLPGVVQRVIDEVDVPGRRRGRKPQLFLIQAQKPAFRDVEGLGNGCERLPFQVDHPSALVLVHGGEFHADLLGQLCLGQTRGQSCLLDPFTGIHVHLPLSFRGCDGPIASIFLVFIIPQHFQKARRIFLTRQIFCAIFCLSLKDKLLKRGPPLFSSLQHYLFKTIQR